MTDRYWERTVGTMYVNYIEELTMHQLERLTTKSARPLIKLEGR